MAKESKREKRWAPYSTDERFKQWHLLNKSMIHCFNNRGSRGSLYHQPQGVCYDGEFLSVKYVARIAKEDRVNEYLTTSRLKLFLREATGVYNMIVDVTPAEIGCSVFYDVLMKAKPITDEQCEELKSIMDNPSLRNDGRILTDVSFDEWEYLMSVERNSAFRTVR